MSRHDGRAADALRPVRIATGWQKDPLGSALFEAGATRVLCAVSLEERVPPFLVGRGEGWVTAEYGMLPGSTDTRAPREATRGRQSGRTLEIQRLVGRAMRAVVDRKALGERTLWIDCDVLQADGGTRTASITGGFVALAVALKAMQERGLLGKPPLTGQVAAISVGIVDGGPALDLDYAEDSSAEVDMNVVRTDAGLYIELQGTAEKRPFDRKQLDALLALADAGIDRLLALQREAIGPALDGLLAPPR